MTDETSETEEGSRSAVRDFRNFEPRTLNVELRIAPFSYVSHFTRSG
jgi:hypothetical protein